MASLVIKALLIASLLAHTVLGCCWHHAHGSECAEESAGDTPHCHAEHAPHAAAGHHDAAQAVAGEFSQHLPAPCDELDCAFIKSAPAQLDIEQSLAVAIVLTPSSATAARQLTLDRASIADGARVTGAALRAVLQVWLT